MSRPRDPGPWPHRLALGAALAAVPLVLFGGSVTTLGAGMAVDGWLVAEGHFLLFFPVERWFRDTSTFVEHTHRLFGVLVGLFALACAAATLLRERRAPARCLALLSLVAVCLQGTLGGLRVLADDSDMAFLHGALAQAVFALLCANALFQSTPWRLWQPVREPTEGGRELRWLGTLALLAVYGQVFAGAWYRHALRPWPEPGAPTRLALHALGAVVVLLVLVLFLRRAARLRETPSGVPAGLARSLRRLPVLLLVQLLLGGLAWAGFRPGAIGPAEWGLSVAHVLGGGLLLAETTILWMWTIRRSGSVRGELHGAPSPAATWRQA